MLFDHLSRMFVFPYRWIFHDRNRRASRDDKQRKQIAFRLSITKHTKRHNNGSRYSRHDEDGNAKAVRYEGGSRNRGSTTTHYFFRPDWDHAEKLPFINPEGQ